MLLNTVTAFPTRKQQISSSKTTFDGNIYKIGYSTNAFKQRLLIRA